MFGRRCLGWNNASQKTTRVKSREAGEESCRVAGSGTRGRLRQCLKRYRGGCKIRKGGKDEVR